MLWFTLGQKNMKRRSGPAIALNKSSDRGGRYFMSLYIGKRLHRYQCTDLPIDYDVISQLRYSAEEQDTKKMTDNYPMFEWSLYALINRDVSEEYTSIREETELNNNETEGEVNVEEENEKNDNYETEDIEDNNDKNEIGINNE